MFFYDSYDIVIVGGGISGLFLAYKLVDTDLNILVLEKEKEFGGRIHTILKNHRLKKSVKISSDKLALNLLNVKDVNQAIKIFLTNILCCAHTLYYTPLIIGIFLCFYCSSSDGFK